MRLSYTEMEILLHHLRRVSVEDGDQISPNLKHMLIRRGYLESYNGYTYLTVQGKKVALQIRLKFQVMSHLRRLKARYRELKHRWVQPCNQ